MLKTAIIGITGYGTEHLRLLHYGHKQGFLQPCAAVVINPGKCPDSLQRLQKTGCRIYDSVDAMWAEEDGKIDLCMIPSPISTHYPFARMALENGSHVLLEKPVCGSIDRAESLARCAQKAGRKICIGFQDLYSPQIVELKRRLIAGDFGRILSAKGWGSWPRAAAYYKRNDWAGKLKNGVGWVLDSPINNAMAHFLFLMLYWTGSELQAYARPTSLEADLYRIQDIESFDTASMRLKTAEGPEIFYAVSHSGKETVQPILRIEGEKGWFEWTHCGHIRLCLPDADETYPCLDIATVREIMMKQIFAWISGEASTVVRVEDGLLHTQIVSALHDAGPIIDFPQDRIVDSNVDGHGSRYVDGLCEVLEKAYNSRRLLCEVEPELAREAKPAPFDLTDYHVFEGRYAGEELSVE